MDDQLPSYFDLINNGCSDLPLMSPKRLLRRVLDLMVAFVVLLPNCGDGGGYFAKLLLLSLLLTICLTGDWCCCSCCCCCWYDDINWSLLICNGIILPTDASGGGGGSGGCVVGNGGDDDDLWLILFIRFSMMFILLGDASVDASELIKLLYIVLGEGDVPIEPNELVPVLLLSYWNGFGLYCPTRVVVAYAPKLLLYVGEWGFWYVEQPATSA